MSRRKNGRGIRRHNARRRRAFRRQIRESRVSPFPWRFRLTMNTMVVTSAIILIIAVFEFGPNWYLAGGVLAGTMAALFLPLLPQASCVCRWLH